MAILWPAFALFALTAIVMVRLARLRFGAVAAGSVNPKFYKVLRGDGEPDDVAACARNLNNLFEAPTLFYAGTAIAYAAGQSGTALIALGWAYVAARILHSAIHLGPNRVLWRFRAFAVSWLILIAFWAVLGAGIALSGAAA